MDSFQSCVDVFLDKIRSDIGRVVVFSPSYCIWVELLNSPCRWNRSTAWAPEQEQQLCEPRWADRAGLGRRWPEMCCRMNVCTFTLRCCFSGPSSPRSDSRLKHVSFANISSLTCHRHDIFELCFTRSFSVRGRGGALTCKSGNWTDVCDSRLQHLSVSSFLPLNSAQLLGCLW